MKKLLAILLVSLMSVSLLSACGGSNTSSTGAKEDTDTQINKQFYPQDNSMQTLDSFSDIFKLEQVEGSDYMYSSNASEEEVIAALEKYFLHIHSLGYEFEELGISPQTFNVSKDGQLKIVLMLAYLAEEEGYYIMFGWQ